MSLDCFLDTNILVYAVSNAAEELPKKQAALDLIETTDFGLSSQVLQEFYVTVTGKIRVPLEPHQAVEFLEEFRAFPAVATDYPLIVSGIELSLRYGVSYWDGTILAAAQMLGASVLYTEDLSHGQQYDSVKAINPFSS